jgi:hypothetical protein
LQLVTKYTISDDINVIDSKLITIINFSVQLLLALVI